MKPFITVTTMIAWVLFSNTQQQRSTAEKQLLFEKRAIADTQRTLASDLDAELPRLPFANWFDRIAGPGAGVVWQLSECGGPSEASGQALQNAAPDATSNAAHDMTVDIRACVEANTILTDGRGVIVRIAVGTFKKGITGAPAFCFGVIEQEGELLLVRRLRDLHKQLSEPRRLPDRAAIKLPDVNMPSVRLAANNAYVADWPARGGEDFSQTAPVEEPAPAEPPAPTARAPSNTNSPNPTSNNEDKQNVSGAVLQGAAIVKAQPVYPRSAKRFNASGPVEVRITISADGRVTGAQAISGHPLLREAAIEAARKWVFRPTTVNDVPVETQLALTFVFTIPQ
jgi:TonB family protein